jgi:hypothetical protein
VTGSCEHGSEPSVYKKCRQFIDKLKNYNLLKQVSIPYSQTDRQTGGWMDIWMDGQKDGRVDGPTDGQTDRQIGTDKYSPHDKNTCGCGTQKMNTVFYKVTPLGPICTWY